VKNLNQQERKLRGAYYTPPAIAKFLTHWAIRSPKDEVLEPSCGDGTFVAAASQMIGKEGGITGIEISSEEAELASSKGGSNTTIICGDAFSWWHSCNAKGKYDAVIGNPPFIRYQDFKRDQRELALGLMVQEGLKPSKLTNAWMPFVVMATQALREGGRLAFVLPAELFQVGYAAQLREYLTRKYDKIRLITFKQRVFEGIQQETILFLGERRDCKSAMIGLADLKDSSELDSLSVDQVCGIATDLNHKHEKWIQYYLNNKEIHLLRELSASADIPRLSDFADVNVGIVTGRNSFFVMNQEVANNLALAEWCAPIIGRSFHIPGLLFNLPELEALRSDNCQVFLLKLEYTNKSTLPAEALKYIEWGENEGYHRGYKCKIRLPAWWKIPSWWIPDGFMLRQIHTAPKIVANSTGATTTDTVHRVRAHLGVDIDQIASASVNSMTLAFSEIYGRSYGGGVLELEPREAVNLPFPRICHDLDIDKVDELSRTARLPDLIDVVDGETLEPMGLTMSEGTMLRNIWDKLSSRRHARK